MRRLFFILFILACLQPFAQEPLMPVMPEQDSVMMEAERSVMYQQLLSGKLFSGEILEPLQLPDFDFRSELANSRYNDSSGISMNQWSFGRIIPGSFGISPAPFLRNETVFSGAAYQLNNRFTLGGYSFGANSLFSAPFPNQGINNFDVRGSTLFMQYNVSKNFKIETRVNVTQGPGF